MGFSYEQINKIVYDINSKLKLNIENLLTSNKTIIDDLLKNAEQKFNNLNIPVLDINKQNIVVLP